VRPHADGPIGMARQSSLPAVALARRLLVFSLLWVVVAGGAPGSWTLGVPVVLAATAASMQLRSRRPESARQSLRLLPALRFAAFFGWQSLRGGVDVALRALAPGLPIDPGFVTHRLAVPPGPARVLVVDVVSLLPGSLSVSLDDDRLTLHVIDMGVDVEGALRTVERHACAIFGLAPTGSAPVSPPVSPPGPPVA
jgi:multicomponent Na+:H+ antiporter subunit E